MDDEFKNRIAAAATSPLKSVMVGLSVGHDIAAAREVSDARHCVIQINCNHKRSRSVKAGIKIQVVPTDRNSGNQRLAT